MNSRKIFLLVAALVIGFGTMMLARSSLHKQAVPVAATADATAPVVSAEIAQVVAAAVDLPAGTLLKESDLKWLPWPKNALSEGLAVKGQKDIKDFVGAVVRQGLRKDEPVGAGRVMLTHERGFLSAVLTPGMRAMTIPVTPASGVAGFAFPGDHVDVIVTHKVSHPVTDAHEVAERRASETVLENVRVLALDQKTNDQAKEAKPAQLATLEVTSGQAEKLALSVDMGTLALVLRSVADDVKPVDAGELGLPPEVAHATLDSDVSSVMPRPASRNGQTHKVQILRGKDSSEIYFDAR